MMPASPASPLSAGQGGPDVPSTRLLRRTAEEAPERANAELLAETIRCLSRAAGGGSWRDRCVARILLSLLAHDDSLGACLRGACVQAVAVLRRDSAAA